MSCYFIAQINIQDEVEYARYLEAYDEVFENYAGRVLAVDDSVSVLEGRWPFSRTVIIEFPSDAHLHAWFDSPDYQAIATHRRNSSAANIVVVKGRG